MDSTQRLGVGHVLGLSVHCGYGKGEGACDDNKPSSLKIWVHMGETL